MEISKYILIEGTDMAGKTTTASNFLNGRSEAWGLRHNSLLDTPNRLGTTVDQMTESRDYDKTAINLAYAASVLIDIDLFEWPQVNTIQESASIVRSIAYAHVNNDKEVESILMKYLDRMPEFDRAFYLAASHTSRLSRLALRGMQSKNDKLIVRDPKRFFAIDNIAKNIAIDKFSAQVIDTSEMTEAVVQKILKEEIDKLESNTSSTDYSSIP